MRWFINLKIGVKLIIGFIIVSIIAGAIGIVGVTSLHEVGDVRLPSIQNLLIISKAQANVILAERALINRRMMDSELRQAQYAYIDAAFKMAEEAWTRYEPLPQTVEEAKVWTEFVVKWGEWVKDHKIVYDLSVEKDQLVSSGISLESVMIEELDEKILEASLHTRTAFLNAENLLNQLIIINQEVAEQETKKANTMIVIFTVFGVVISLVLGIFISKIITNPIKSIVSISQKIADGDLDVEIEVKSKDETGALSKAFKKMAQKLNEDMTNIASSAEQVAT